MKNLKPEEIVTLATLYSVELSKNCTVKEMKFFAAASY